MKITQQEREEAQFASFREQVSHFPAGEVERITGDIDFKIATSTGILGIEFTRVASESMSCELQQLSLANYVCERAMEMSRASGLANKMIDVHFSSENSIAEQRRQPLANELFQKVKEALNSDTCGKLTLVGWRDNLPEEISNITIHDTPSLIRPLWQIAGGGQVIEDCVTEIQTTVNKKHEKLERYRKTCTECWLVIVSDVWERSDIEPNRATRTHTYTSCFDRTYFMMYGLKKVWQLTTQSPA